MFLKLKISLLFIFELGFKFWILHRYHEFKFNIKENDWTFANCIEVKGNLLLNSRCMNLNLWHNLRRVDRFASVKAVYSRWRYEKGHFMAHKKSFMVFNSTQQTLIVSTLHAIKNLKLLILKSTTFTFRWPLKTLIMCIFMRVVAVL